MFESRISAGGSEKLPFPQNLRISSWSYDMAGHAKKCVERYCELANKTTQQLYKVSTPCIDDHHFKEEEMKSVGELSHVCSKIVLKCLYLARVGRPDILWSVNQLARSITKWIKACDKRLNRLISYIHHTSEYKQYCHVGNIAKQCRLGLFQDSGFAGDLEDSKSTSGGTLCVFGSHTFVPIGWMCKKQTAVSHSSTESEIISLDTGLRLDGLLALELWDLIVSVLGNVSRVSDRTGQPVNGKNKSYNKIDVIGKKQNINPTWKILMKDVDLGEPTSFLDHVYLGCTQRQCEISKDFVDNYRSMFESRISVEAIEKQPSTGKLDANISSWSYDMEGHAKKCVERFCEFAN